VSLSSGDEAPHIFIRKSLLQVGKFASSDAKRLFATISSNCGSIAAMHYLSRWANKTRPLQHDQRYAKRKTASWRYRRLSYFHLLLSIFAESVIRQWSNDSVFLRCYCFMDRPKKRTARFRVSSWSNRSLQANRRSISPASNRTRTGDTMIKTNTLSMAVFALLVNSTVLLSLSM